MKYDQITEAKKNREDKLEVVKLPYKLGDLSPVPVSYTHLTLPTSDLV